MWPGGMHGNGNSYDMGIGFPWESHGHGNSFKASDGNRSENGNGNMGMGITYFVCVKIPMLVLNVTTLRSHLTNKNTSGDEIANVNFFYDDSLHALQTIVRF